jgi:hypothetical protein
MNVARQIVPILPSTESEVVSVETTKVISVKSAKPEIVAIEASHRETVSGKSPEPEVIAIETPHRETIIEAVHAETKPLHWHRAKLRSHEWSSKSTAMHPLSGCRLQVQSGQEQDCSCKNEELSGHPASPYSVSPAD